jgi:hypothetical protein
MLYSQIATGPASSVAGDLVSFAGTAGKVLSDSGVVAANVVTGPASAVNGDLALFSGTTGKLIAQSGIPYTAVVQGPASVTSGDVPQFGDATGKVLADSGKLAWSLTTGPASSLAGDVPQFGDATGKVLADSGKLAWSLTTGPASSLAGDVAYFSDATGKVLADANFAYTDVQRKSTPGFTSVAFNAANFSQSGSGSWTVPGINVMGYVTAGRICVYTVSVQASTVGAGSNYLIITLAGGAPASAAAHAAAIFLYGANSQNVHLGAQTGGSQLQIFREDAAVFVSGSLPAMLLTVSYAY